MDAVKFARAMNRLCDDGCGKCPLDRRNNNLQAEKEGRLMVLPCKIGTHLWRVTYPYRQAPKVTEYIVRNFRTVGSKHRLQIEVHAMGTPISNWMRYDDFYTTREEAEAELEASEG